MGNCAPITKKVSHQTPPPPVELYGPANSPTTWRVRLALLYKAAPARFHPSEDASAVAVQVGSGKKVTGSADEILRYLDRAFPGPRILVEEAKEVPGLAAAAELHHRSIVRHLERVAAWAEHVASRCGVGSGGEVGRGSPRMEMRRFERTYGEVVELMVEHAQMEERLVFPLLEGADPGFCKVATEEHARDLPIMNGIREDIKSIIVLDSGGPSYQEALLNLAHRLKTLLEHCKEHFGEEERELLPVLELAKHSGGRRREEGPVDRLMEAMEATHSRLFHVLIAGLLPHEAMRYLSLVCTCRDGARAAEALKSLAATMELASSACQLRRVAKHQTQRTWEDDLMFQAV